MHILIAPDKFKDSLSAHGVVNAITSGIHNADPSIKIDSLILSDGGDGFLEAIKNNISNLKLIELASNDASGRSINTHYGLDSETNSAFIELALSSGIAQLEHDDRNALYTSTFGSGLVIKDAIRRECKEIYIGLGGSATNDGGCGIAAALGYRFLDDNGKHFVPTAITLRDISKIIVPDVSFKNLKIYAVNDVTNPLLGNNGATYTYGLQKGIKKIDLAMVEHGMVHLSKKVLEIVNTDFSSVVGAGAAGGTAFGLKAFLNAKFISGIDFMINRYSDNLNSLLTELDLIITGEGKIDDQTSFGKLVQGIATLGTKHKIPVVAFCGKNNLKNSNASDLGLSKIIEIRDQNKSLDYNLKNAKSLLKAHSAAYIKTLTNTEL